MKILIMDLKILKDLYIDYDDIEYTVFGISGCDSPNDYKIIMDEILKIGINKEKYIWQMMQF